MDLLDVSFCLDSPLLGPSKGSELGVGCWCSLEMFSSCTSLVKISEVRFVT